jgi:hypothetical protein
MAGARFPDSIEFEAILSFAAELPGSASFGAWRP